MFNKLIRQDGFYAGNFSKNVDGENRLFFSVIFFIGDSIFYIMKKVDASVTIDNKLIQVFKDSHSKAIKDVKSGEITIENSPLNFAKYNEKSGTVTAEFKDGTDDVKFILVPIIFSGALLYVELEGYKIDWSNPTDNGLKKRRIINGEKIKFFKY